jgi:hypothetical protein
MGEPLGSQYSALWQEVVQVYVVWSQFVTLYGTKPSRVEILNRSAANFFFLVEKILFESIMLHIARLTDPSHSLGKKDRSNLTIQNLPALLNDGKLKTEVTKLVGEAIGKSQFCRDWRNRHIAHRDLDLALNNFATPLESASIDKTNSALSAIAEVLNAIQLHFRDGQTAFDFAEPSSGALTLLYLLDDGLKAKAARLERLRRREILDDDHQEEV